MERRDREDVVKMTRMFGSSSIGRRGVDGENDRGMEEEGGMEEERWTTVQHKTTTVRKATGDTILSSHPMSSRLRRGGGTWSKANRRGDVGKVRRYTLEDLQTLFLRKIEEVRQELRRRPTTAVSSNDEVEFVSAVVSADEDGRRKRGRRTKASGDIRREAAGASTKPLTFAEVAARPLATVSR
jgi:hypothetical protein